MRICTKCNTPKELDQFSKYRVTYCRECYNKYMCLYQNQHRDKKRLKDREYAARNRIKAKNKASIYYHTNKHEPNFILKRRANVRKRRAMKLKVRENYSKQDEVFTRQVFNHMCFKCKSTDKLCIDHHYPLVMGCPLSLDDAVLLCQTCNGAKTDYMPEDFYSPIELLQVEILLAYSLVYR